MFGYRGIGYRKWLYGFSITERSVIEVLLYLHGKPDFLYFYVGMIEPRLNNFIFRRRTPKIFKMLFSKKHDFYSPLKVTQILEKEIFIWPALDFKMLCYLEV